MPTGETTTNRRTDVAELARLIGLHARVQLADHLAQYLAQKGLDR